MQDRLAQARALSAAQRYHEALPLLIDAYNADTSDIDLLCEVGFGFLACGHMEQAADALGRVDAARPPRADVLMNLAVARINAGQMEGGIAACERALDLGEPPKAAYDILFQTYAQLHRWEDVDRLLFRLVERYGSGLEPHDLIHAVIQRLPAEHARERALQALARAMPNNLAALINLTNHYYLSGRGMEAKAVLRQALRSRFQFFAGEVDAMGAQLAEFQMQEGDFDGARRTLDDVIRRLRTFDRAPSCYASLKLLFARIGRRDISDTVPMRVTPVP
jgi:tetratricopeptide (TPR) repeat protein